MHMYVGDARLWGENSCNIKSHSRHPYHFCYKWKWIMHADRYLKELIHDCLWECRMFLQRNNSADHVLIMWSGTIFKYMIRGQFYSKKNNLNRGTPYDLQFIWLRVVALCRWFWKTLFVSIDQNIAFRHMAAQTSTLSAMRILLTTLTSCTA